MPSSGLNLPGLADKLKRAPRVMYAVLELHAPHTEKREIPIEELDSIIRRSYDVLNPPFEE